MRTRTLFFMLAAATLLVAGLAGAEGLCSAVSEAAVPLDTRSLSWVAAVEDGDLDTRSFAVGWSEARKLNTSKIAGTVLLLR